MPMVQTERYAEPRFRPRTNPINGKGLPVVDRNPALVSYEHFHQFQEQEGTGARVLGPGTPAAVGVQPPYASTEQMAELIVLLPALPDGEAYLLHKTMRDSAVEGVVGKVHFDHQGLAVVSTRTAQFYSRAVPDSYAMGYGTGEETPREVQRAPHAPARPADVAPMNPRYQQVDGTPSMMDRLKESAEAEAQQQQENAAQILSAEEALTHPAVVQAFQEREEEFRNTKLSYTSVIEGHQESLSTLQNRLHRAVEVPEGCNTTPSPLHVELFHAMLGHGTLSEDTDALFTALDTIFPQLKLGEVTPAEVPSTQKASGSSKRTKASSKKAPSSK